jgi:hypothetical protein
MIKWRASTACEEKLMNSRRLGVSQVEKAKKINVEAEISNLEIVASEIRNVADLKVVLRRINSVQKIVFDEIKRRSTL